MRALCHIQMVSLCIGRTGVVDISSGDSYSPDGAKPLPGPKSLKTRSYRDFNWWRHRSPQWKQSAMTAVTTELAFKNPDSKVHGANMGPTWVLSAPNGPHVGLMNLAIRGTLGFQWFFIELCWWQSYLHQAMRAPQPRKETWLTDVVKGARLRSLYLSQGFDCDCKLTYVCLLTIYVCYIINFLRAGLGVFRAQLVSIPSR